MANSFANTHQTSETIRQRQAEKRIVSLLFLAAKDQVVPIFEVLDQARGCHGPALYHNQSGFVSRSR